MSELIKYPNGLRLVVSNNPTVRSVVMGIWVGAGSTRETAGNNGISHFTEHVMFKGTDRYSAFDIANAFESMGALINAFTGKEATCYYTKAVDEYAEKCFSMLAHIFTKSSFDADELDKERKVIIEEINMGEDSPEDICYDLIAKALYGNSSLGQTILGPIDNVRSFTRDDVLSYMNDFYNADNIVISMSGNIDIETADKLVKRYILREIRQNNTQGLICGTIDVTSNMLTRIKDFEQSNIAVSFPTVPFNHALSSTQSVFSILFGGGMSSRLFQRIREQMGLAYSVYSSPLAYKNNGNFNVVLNITATNTQKAVAAAVKEIGDIVRDGVTEEEFLKAKIQLKSALVFSEESIQNTMSSQGKLMLFSGELYSVDKKIKEIDDVSLAGVNKFIRTYLNADRACAAYVGKESGTDIMSIVKGAW